MKPSHLLLLCCLAILPVGAQAAGVHKCTDKNGQLIGYFTNPKDAPKGSRCKELPTERLTTTIPAPTAQRNHENFPRVDSETQTRRDDTRRKILEDELKTEQKALEEARLNLKDGQDNPEVYKGADGKTFRNVQKYEEKVNELQDEVTSHEQNVEALKTELSHIAQ